MKPPSHVSGRTVCRHCQMDIVAFKSPAASNPYWVSVGGPKPEATTIHCHGPSLVHEPLLDLPADLQRSTVEEWLNA